uniref:Uncharacterized protein n=1 Tax=Meloidogyne hapla TaxID=6305 RepID=A0A1I8BAL3_MELHA
MYFKLIFCVFFLLIFINISSGKKCKCKNGEKSLIHRRNKRGVNCSCLGGDKQTKPSRKGKKGKKSSSRTKSRLSRRTSFNSIVEEEGSGFYETSSYKTGSEYHGSEYHGEIQEEVSLKGYSFEQERTGGGSYVGESSTGGGYGTHTEIEEVLDGRKKALYICDNFYFSHVQLNSDLAEVLSEKYAVVCKYEE